MNLDQLRANNQLKRPGMYDNTLFQNYQISFIHLEVTMQKNHTDWNSQGNWKMVWISRIQIIWIGVKFQLS